MAKSKQRFHAVLGRDEHCCVCGRVQFGDWQVLPFGHWRHDDCKPGSVNWVDAYVASGKKTEAGEYFLHWANEGRPR